MIILLTFINALGLRFGKIIQNVFTSAKTLALIILILVGLFIGGAAGTFSTNWSNIFTPQNAAVITPDSSFLPPVSMQGGIADVQSGLFAVIVVMCIAQVGSLFSSDAWNNITFTAGEVKNPRRNIPLSLVLGTGLVTGLYLIANFAYLSTLPLSAIQNAPQDRVGTAALEVIFGAGGGTLMAVAIIISTFGCNNGLVLAGARVYYAMAKDKLFFSATKKLNKYHVPAVALALQCVWACLLVLPRTRSGKMEAGVEIYGNLYGMLLDYVVFAVLIFYILTIIGIFILRRKKPHAERPYKAFGYPVIPLVYISAAFLISTVLLFYKPQTSIPGLLIVLTGVPVYLIWKNISARNAGT
jgi:APA family basic amino acid/polyamine antiporter